MKQIKIKSKIVNDLNEEKLVDTIGEYDEKNHIISYYDRNVLVNIILGDEIVIKREHPNYQFELKFNEKENRKTIYDVFYPKSEFELNVCTHSIKQYEKELHIKYSLKLNNEDMGMFTLDVLWEE